MWRWEQHGSLPYFICRNWFEEHFPFSACRFQLSEYRWNEFLDTACYFAFGRNWIICVYILGDSFLLQTSGSIKEVQNRMNWLSAARRQKKKSRRRADTFSRAYETAALIFRAAVSLRVRLAAHVSNGWKSLIHPSSGKDIAKTKGVLFIELLWLTRGESEGRWRQISGLTNRNHIRLQLRIRLHDKLKSNNYSELTVVLTGTKG